jgi:hypothetical protein
MLPPLYLDFLSAILGFAARTSDSLTPEVFAIAESVSPFLTV